MKKKVYAALISLAAAAVCAAPAEASAKHDGHRQQSQPHAAKRAHSRARTARGRAKASRRAVAYICPMHPDIRERARGTCPKCQMDLVARPRAAKARGM